MRSFHSPSVVVDRARDPTRARGERFMPPTALAWTPEGLRATIANADALDAAFANAGGARDGVIRGGDAVAFLRPSALPDAALSKIWRNATKGAGTLRSARELGECLELVARELETSLAAGYATPAAKAMGGAFERGTPRTPASGEVANAAPMTEVDRKKYYGHFRTLDVNGTGVVGVDAAVRFLSKAALPMLSVQLCVAKASKGASSIDKDMFATAMHEVYALIRANGATPVTPMVTPSGPPSMSASDSAPKMATPAPKAAGDDNFFSSMGAPTLGATAREVPKSASGQMLDTLSAPALASKAVPTAVDLERNAEREAKAQQARREAERIERETEAKAQQARREAERIEREAEAKAQQANREAERVEREAEAKAQQAQRQAEALSVARAAAEARIERAKKAMDDADASVKRAKETVDAREAEAEKMQRNATEQIEKVKQQRNDLVQRESRIKTEAIEALAAKKAQYESTVAEFERLRAQVASAAAVAALPVKTMESKLAKVEEETRVLKMQTDKAAAEASQILVQKAVEVAKAERTKAAALREMQAVETKLDTESSRITKQLEALHAETESYVARREARLAAHPQLMDDLSANVEKAKLEAVAAKEETEAAIVTCDKEQSELQAKSELAKAELEAVKSMMESDVASHKSRVQESEIAYANLQQTLETKLKARYELAQTQAEEMSALEDKIAETEAAIRADEAAVVAQQRIHQEDMAEKEGKIRSLEAQADDLRTTMQNQELTTQQALADAEERLGVAEAKLQTQREELELASAKLAQDSHELAEKLRMAKEKEAEAVQAKVDHAVLLASQQHELEELRSEVATESARIAQETEEIHSQIAVAQAALKSERDATAKALQQLRETIPKTAAVNAQIQALLAAKGTAEFDRFEAETAAAKSQVSYEEVLTRLEAVALEAAENEAGQKVPSFVAERKPVTAAVTASPLSAVPVAKSPPPARLESLPQFVDFEVSPGAEFKSPVFDATFDDPEPFDKPEPFGGAEDAFAAPSELVFSNDEDFGEIVSAPFVASDDFEFDAGTVDAGAFAAPGPSPSEMNAFSLEVPDMAIFGDGAFDQFVPESNAPDSPFDPSPRSIEFTGADAFGSSSEVDSGTPTEDPFSLMPKEPPTQFTTFDNDAFTSSDDPAPALWQDDGASSPPRQETSWRADEDQFTTAQKHPDAYGTHAYEAATPMGSVFATPGTLAFPASVADEAFGAFEEPPPTPAQNFVDAEEEYEETAPEELLPIPSEDLSRSSAAWEKLRGDASASGVSGAQIVSLATKTGLANADLATIWNLSCTTGASELNVQDFAIFMHFLKHRVNGGDLPESMDDEKRAYLLGLPYPEDEPPSPPAAIYTDTVEDEEDQPMHPTPIAERGSAELSIGSPSRLRIFIESVANVKDSEKMSSSHFSVTLVDGEGTPLEPSQNTPIGVQIGPEGLMRVQSGVTLNSIPDQWPEGSAVVLELRHFKDKEKKMSTRCWSFMEKDSIRQGLFGLPLAVKPADTKRRKVKLYNKGNPDLKIRFTLE